MVDPSTRLPRGARRRPDFDYTRDDHAYFVTIRARAGTQPFTDPRLASLVVDTITWLRKNRGIRVYAYCLMPDHAHLLLQLPLSERGEGQPGTAGLPQRDDRDGHQNKSLPESPDWALSSIIHSLKSYTTHRSWKLGYRGQLWQERYYDHIVRRLESGQAIAEYILANPVRKGIVESAEEYPYSGTPDPL